MKTTLLALLVCLPLAAQVPNPDCNRPGRPPVDPKLCKHSNFFNPATIWDIQRDPRIAKYKPAGLRYDAYLPVGYDLANTIVLKNRATKEIVIVDTLGDADTTANVIQQLAASKEKILESTTNIPFRSLIYTHNHIDHTGGVLGWISAASMKPCASTTTTAPDGVYDADKETCLPVIGQSNIVDSVINTGTVVGTIINQRSAYMYGSYLVPDGIINDGIGPKVNVGPSGFYTPSRMFTNELHVKAAGLWMELVYVPSETNDELAVFLPDRLNGTDTYADPADPQNWKGPGLLLSAEVIQGPSFPNLYSLRGTSYRNPATWFRSVDKLRTYDSWCMLPSHGTPLCGADNIHTVLRNFRDAIQYTHDQTVRNVNKGRTIEELPQHVVMPQYLIEDLATVETAKPPEITDPRDYLTFFYGSVPQAVREIYFGYVGWFEGDPVALDPLPPAEGAKRTVALMGGAAKVTAEAEASLKKATKTDVQWAAQLATLVLRADAANAEAKRIKALAYRELAPPQTNPNWRNWYITSQRELAGLVPKQAIPGGLTSRAIVTHLPYYAWVNQWTMRLKAEETIARNVRRGLAIRLSDTGESYSLLIRKAVCEFINGKAAAELVLTMTSATLDQLITADDVNHPNAYLDTLTKLIGDGTIQVQGGGAKDAVSFFENFDKAPDQAIPLSLK